MRLHGKARALMRRAETVRCKRDCWLYCGVFMVTPEENERIRAFCAEHDVPFHDLRAMRPERDVKVAAALGTNDIAAMMERGVGLCPFLANDFSCTVHPARPLICRLWGAIEELPCPMGCEPEGGRLTVRETQTLLEGLKQSGRWNLRAAVGL